MSTESEATPRYHGLSDEEFGERVAHLKARYADCDLCAYDCRVDRTAGKIGTCQVDDTVYVSTYFPHFGEEDCPSKAGTAAGRSSSRTAT